MALIVYGLGKYCTCTKTTQGEEENHEYAPISVKEEALEQDDSSTDESLSTDELSQLESQAQHLPLDRCHSAPMVDSPHDEEEDEGVEIVEIKRIWLSGLFLLL